MLENIFSKVIKGIRIFSILSIGAMLAMILEYGIKAEFIFCLFLALFLCVCTNIKIKGGE